MTGIKLTTAAGTYTGQLDRDVLIFRGLRYAADCSGARRFHRPAPPVPHSDVRDCLDFAPSCPQAKRIRGLTALRLLGIPAAEQRESEDCLGLNIWARLDAVAAPVLVWFHSGLSTGSGSWPWYDGAHFARTHGIVVVSFNSRLGPLGYLDTTELLGDQYSANVGVLDCLAALEWVAQNIAEVGGDPSRITIGGSCAGAARVHALLATRAGDGLFAQAIVQSRQGPDVVDRDVAARNAAVVWPADRKSFERASVRDIVDAAAGVGVRLGPVVDGELFGGSMFEHACAVPLLVGANRDEVVPPNQIAVNWTTATERDVVELLQPLVGEEAVEIVHAEVVRTPHAHLRDVYQSLLGVYECIEPTRQVALRNVAHSAATFMYRLDWTTTLLGSRPRTPHGIDVPFALGNTRRCPIAARDPASETLSATMSEAWASFIRSGRPGAAGLPEWPDYGKPGNPFLAISSDPQLLTTEVL
ncbi:MAG TPA: carboxylesterase family protein [Jatrophihabitans sp.]|nr:carboxylesterase family protein [Jatrophihabitans sp.]